MIIKSNQYGAWPTRTYYYIQDSAGNTWHHKDSKWRKSPLKEMSTHAYYNREAAANALKALRKQSY